jgi:hypothetical protein
MAVTESVVGDHRTINYAYEGTRHKVTFGPCATLRLCGKYDDLVVGQPITAVITDVQGTVGQELATVRVIGKHACPLKDTPQFFQLLNEFNPWDPGHLMRVMPKYYPGLTPDSPMVNIVTIPEPHYGLLSQAAKEDLAVHGFRTKNEKVRRQIVNHALAMRHHFFEHPTPGQESADDANISVRDWLNILEAVGLVEPATDQEWLTRVKQAVRKTRFTGDIDCIAAQMLFSYGGVRAIVQNDRAGDFSEFLYGIPMPTR